MDLTSIVGSLLSGETVSAASSAAGAKEDTTAAVLQAALPYLMHGLTEQAKDEDKSDKVAQALSTHAQNDTSDLTSFLSNVDTEDGAKILNHLFGATDTDAAQKIAKKSGVSVGQATSILSVVAPLLMSLVGQHTQQQQQQQTSSGAGLAGVLGSLLLSGGLDLDGDGKKDQASDLIGKLVGGLFSSN